MLKNKLIDGIISEPLGGAHLAPDVAAENIKKVIISELKVLNQMSSSERIEARIDKFSKMGVVKE
jgi:acetyl-CoA carboxylase carboxyl transferase subunit alpha